MPCEGHQGDPQCLEDLKGLEDLVDLEEPQQPQLFQQEETHLQQTLMTG
jgi:hypothetical protein